MPRILVVDDNFDTARTFYVVLRGAGREDDRKRALEAGCDDYLQKPVDPFTLERMLRLAR